MGDKKMRQLVRLTETDLHNIIKESVNKILKEDLTYKQIKNITGIEDDDELNASVHSEDAEEVEHNVWESLVEMANGDSPRRHIYNFKDFANMLYEKFGFEYLGSDIENECHEFENEEFKLDVFPRTFYEKQGLMRIENFHVY